MSELSFYNCYCGAQCLHLVHPEKPYNQQPFRCSKYDIDLDYYDWVNRALICCRENGEEENEMHLLDA